jgi:ABC-type transporter Mla subunit MlaD
MAPGLAVALRASSPGGPVRQTPGVRVERTRENVFTVTATGQELSALVAGARLALDAMRASRDAPATAVELLGRVLDDFDRSREQLSEPPPNGDRR